MNPLRNGNPGVNGGARGDPGRGFARGGGISEIRRERVINKPLWPETTPSRLSWPVFGGAGKGNQRKRMRATLIGAAIHGEILA